MWFNDCLLFLRRFNNKSFCKLYSSIDKSAPERDSNFLSFVFNLATSTVYRYCGRTQYERLLQKLQQYGNFFISLQINFLKFMQCCTFGQPAQNLSQLKLLQVNLFLHLQYKKQLSYPIQQSYLLLYSKEQKDLLAEYSLS